MKLYKIRQNRTLHAMAYLSLICYLMAAFPLTLLAADSTTEIKHKPFEYYNSGKRISVESEIEDEAGINLVRLYFKNDLQADYLFVPMTLAEGDTYKAVVPALDKTAKSLSYLFLVVNKNNVVVKSQEFSAKLDDDQKSPAWQEAGAEDQITLYTELPEATQTPLGYTDSIAMDAVESGARFGVVVGGIYAADRLSASSASGTAAGGASAGGAAVTGTAAAATSGGVVMAGVGGMSALGIGAIVAGAVVVGGGAAAAIASGGSDGDSSSDGGGQVTTVTLVGSWYVTESSRSDWHMNATLNSNQTFTETEYSSGSSYSGSGSWSYNSSSKYFTITVTGGGNMGGTISGTANDFHVDGHWADGSSGYFHWVRQ